MNNLQSLYLWWFIRLLSLGAMFAPFPWFFRLSGEETWEAALSYWVFPVILWLVATVVAGWRLDITTIGWASACGIISILAPRLEDTWEVLIPMTIAVVAVICYWCSAHMVRYFNKCLNEPTSTRGVEF